MFICFDRFEPTLVFTASGPQPCGSFESALKPLFLFTDSDWATTEGGEEDEENMSVQVS